MDTRRKTLGRRIKRARQGAGYRSQKAFAVVVGVHESSVAYAEAGSERVGDTVFGAIERALGWPEDCIAEYLRTGRDDALPAPGGYVTPTAASAPEFRDDIERQLWALDLPESERLTYIHTHRAELAQREARRAQSA